MAESEEPKDPNNLAELFEHIMNQAQEKRQPKAMEMASPIGTIGMELFPEFIIITVNDVRVAQLCFDMNDEVIHLHGYDFTSGGETEEYFQIINPSIQDDNDREEHLYQCIQKLQYEKDVMEIETVTTENKDAYILTKRAYQSGHLPFLLWHIPYSGEAYGDAEAIDTAQTLASAISTLEKYTG